MSVVFAMMAILTVLMAILIVHYDTVVRDKFSGKRWMLPAKVYARPLEVFTGKRLTKEDLVDELTLLGYRKEVSVNSSGAVLIKGNHVQLFSRGFKFYDGEEIPQPVTVFFNGTQVEKVLNDAGQNIPVLRLDPLLIGSIYPAHNEDRILVKLDQAPPYLLDALVTVEDRNYWGHWGLSPLSLMRAMWVNIRSGQWVQGGSTLTQQLVKNFFLTSERTLSRKAEEAIMSVLLETHYEKKEILEAYLNEVFLGQDGNRAIHGFGSASWYYFGRPLSELDLPQVAMLIAIVKGPSVYNPRRAPDLVLKRRNLVLTLLKNGDIISEAQMTQAQMAPLGVTPSGQLSESQYPSFMDLVRRQLRQEYEENDLANEGLRVFTSLDPVMQQKAELAVRSVITQLKSRKGGQQLEAAMIANNPGTGEISVMVGGRQENYAGFNRALDAQRPIGSLIKPIIYLAALERPSQYTLGSVIADEPFSITPSGGGNTWSPSNYDHQFRGNVLLFQALAHSYNIPAVRVGMGVGVPQVLKTVKRLGVKVDWPNYPSMLLGSGAMSPLQVATLYQPLANGGFDTPLRAIQSVLTQKGEPLKRYPYQVQQQFDPGAVYLLQYAMQRTMREGTARSAYTKVSPSINLAGKTGTTNDGRDSWFAGFSQDQLAVVWMGRDDNGQAGLTGASGALQVWADFMKRTNPISLQAPQPNNVTHAWINPWNGLSVDAQCEGAIKLPFIKGSEPVASIDCQTSNLDELGKWIQNQNP